MARYPVFTYVIPAEASVPTVRNARHASEPLREAKLRHVLRFILGVGAIQGEILAPSPAIEAIAVWIRSEHMRFSPVEVLRAGFAMLPIRIGLSATRRLLGVGTTKHAERAKFLTGQYYLLDMLGVEPQWQSKGYGRQLIESKLDAIDRERSRCYLETSDHRNVGYYQRFGFEVVHEYHIHAVPVYCLMRAPSAGGVHRIPRP
jgi:GNAT superfamily N-acetyltransferase